MDGVQIPTDRSRDGAGSTQALLTPDEAAAIALAQVQPIAHSETLALADGLGRISAAEVTAPCAMPFFDNSAMDGFAFRHADLAGRCRLPVSGTVAAGDAARALPEGTALRIFTGAVLPIGADTVVMLESCVETSQDVQIEHVPDLGANIRQAGSDQSAGAVLLARGTRLAAHHIGLLAANGLTKITVTRRPRVAVFSTGDEVTLGARKPGQIPDANRPMLCALLIQHGAEVHDMGILPDDITRCTSALTALDGQFDLVLTSGAVSMGGKDHISAALTAAGGAITGWRVAIKPGKPVMFGTLAQAGFTGLPGNPFAVFVGFHMFVAPQLARLGGATPARFASVPAVAGFDWQRKSGRAEVIPVRLIGYDDATGLPMVDRLGTSVSATLFPLTQADGLAIVAANTASVTSGDRLHWHRFCP